MKRPVKKTNPSKVNAVKKTKPSKAKAIKKAIGSSKAAPPKSGKKVGLKSVKRPTSAPKAQAAAKDAAPKPDVLIAKRDRRIERLAAQVQEAKDQLKAYREEIADLEYAVEAAAENHAEQIEKLEKKLERVEAERDAAFKAKLKAEGLSGELVRREIVAVRDQEDDEEKLNKSRLEALKRYRAENKQLREENESLKAQVAAGLPPSPLNDPSGPRPRAD